MFINPYDLLGVTVATPLDDIKKAYYQMALLVHPDKGGSHEDMMTVHCAYKFILHEVQSIQLDVTVEKLEQEFQNFCKLQTDAVPIFQDIYAEAFDLPKFNQYFDAHACDVSKPFVEEGYGDLMDPSQYDNTTPYNDVETQCPIQTFQAVQVYQDPAEVETHPLVADLNPTRPETFTTTLNKHMVMSDYKEAYTPSTHNGELDAVVPCLDKYMEERKQSDYQDDKVHRGYKWTSQGGLLDQLGNRVKHFFRLQEHNT